MSGLLKNVDVIVSRAGASSISEILALNIPSIIIPSPYVANNHQYYNALDLVDKNMSLLIEEKDLDKETLIDAIDEMFDEETFQKVKENLKQVKDISSSTMIMNEIMKRVKEKDEKKGKKKI
jgi:UDP-N-acetylglucosamine--N-acetylmuramyl-(pentapeptide) pyrophosphoryl-undecaprenol N-acetylglucosamine transferase